MSRAAEVAPDITLYALPHSYYSGKVRSYLRYKGIAYRETLSTLNVFRRVIVPRTGVKYIPVIETRDGEFIQDSTVIIDALESRYPQRSVYPETPRQHLAALLLEILGDEWMLMPGMHYRWSFWHERAHIDDVLEHFGLRLIFTVPAAIIAGSLSKSASHGRANTAATRPMASVRPKAMAAPIQAACSARSRLPRRDGPPAGGDRLWRRGGPDVHAVAGEIPRDRRRLDARRGPPIPRRRKQRPSGGTYPCLPRSAGRAAVPWP